MSEKKYNYMLILSDIDTQIQLLTNEAWSLQNNARLSEENPELYNHASIHYKKIFELYDSYKKYCDINTPIYSMFLLNANMWHAKYDYYFCYARYSYLSLKYSEADKYFKLCIPCINKSINYIEKALPLSSQNKYNDINYDYVRWKFDNLILNASIADNASNIKIKDHDFAGASDSTQTAVTLYKQMHEFVLENKFAFNEEDTRIYKAHINALEANIALINSLQSHRELLTFPTIDTFIDEMIFLEKSFINTELAIQNNNFWHGYKLIRQSIRNDIYNILSDNKNHWKNTISKIQIGQHPLIYSIMQEIDSKKLNKITNNNNGGKFIVNIFKNIKGKGNILINNGNINSINTTNNTFLSVNDTATLLSYIEYIKKVPTSELPDNTKSEIVGCLNQFLHCKDQDSSLIQSNWNSLKKTFTPNVLKVLAIGSDIVTLGGFLKNLLGL